MSKIYIKTMGCKVNTHDSHILETALAQKGHEITTNYQEAEVCLINTCSVTAKADNESRYLARKFKRVSATMKVAITGCYAQTDSDRLINMPEIDLVIPNQDKNHLVEILDTRIQEKFPGATPEDKLPEGRKAISKNRQGHFKTSLTLPKADSNQTRSFLKIQDGCNGFCSYCLIPYARGQSRSVSPEAVKQEVRRQINKGTKEIVFTGIHIGDYGKDETNASKDPFAELLAELFSWKDMIRIRISSLEPGELSSELLKVLAAHPEKFCPHFHFPLQAGSDRILRLMRRSYNKAEYREKVEKARRHFPEAFFGADVIPGFPQETDSDFRETLDFIKDLNLSEIHVFPYSKRPGTAAARFPGHLDNSVIKQRAKILRDLSGTLKQTFLRKNLQTTHEVLWEKQVLSDGRRAGRTRNYINVVSSLKEPPKENTVTTVSLVGFHSPTQLLGFNA